MTFYAAKTVAEPWTSVAPTLRGTRRPLLRVNATYRACAGRADANGCHRAQAFTTQRFSVSPGRRAAYLPTLPARAIFYPTPPRQRLHALHAVLYGSGYTRISAHYGGPYARTSVTTTHLFYTARVLILFIFLHDSWQAFADVSHHCRHSCLPRATAALAVNANGRDQMTLHFYDEAVSAWTHG